jgi:L-ascorbate metabolism protein UlaG (beta-lactamase superfamily)
MTISKHLHSCLLIKDEDKTILIDPGEFTEKEQALDIQKIQNLTHILITHEHADHLSVPLVKQCLEKFPKATILTNASVARKLQDHAINAQTSGSGYVVIENVPHERLFDITPPENSVITVGDKLTHPGDSLQFDKTAEILALPLTAPWGSTTQAVEVALKLKPKLIIPIHDWMWKDGIRKAMYERLTGFFKQHSIDFRGVETGEIIEY